MQFIFLGPPGAGKGTQAIALAQRWQVPHISTGDILRAAIEEGTAVGQEAQTYLAAGELVPDALVMDLVRSRLAQEDAQKGWILDGFPRTRSQAQALDEILTERQLPTPQVIYIKVMTGLLIDRLLKMNRQDDTVSTIRRRIAVYEEETAPLVDYYQQRECLAMVNGNVPAAEVSNAVVLSTEKETGAAQYVQDEAGFDALLGQEALLVVDCTAAWCGPCKLVAPLMDRLAEEYRGQVNVFKMDVDANKSVAKRYGVKGIPAVMFFKGGELRETAVGVKPYAVFQDAVARHMS
ncbi:MAG: adenylate kinase [Cyanobacteria bacterium J06576_12]